jgi:hypothetical protein
MPAVTVVVARCTLYVKSEFSNPGIKTKMELCQCCSMSTISKLRIV